mmetsp:Transcript_45937/g.73566  ORF Transcript_45937/g.73566 Transcript_45937/m.73566 type:complete len:413 (+) Transcript_45937:1054-2292(+)
MNLFDDNDGDDDEFEDNIFDVLVKMANVDEDILLHERGYIKVDTLCRTIQGSLHKALKVSAVPQQQHNQQKFVAIKKTSKTLLQNSGFHLKSAVRSITMQGGFSFCVSENIKKEAKILQYLTVRNSCIGGYLVKFVDFFESDNDYFLVTEYIESQTNLRQFIAKCHQFMEDGKLSFIHYMKTIKFLFWQIAVTITWMHVTMQCCHLDLNTENIMVERGNFVENAKKQTYSIDPGVSIKIIDFGVAEIFNRKVRLNAVQEYEEMELDEKYDAEADARFHCLKAGLNIDNEAYLAPEVFQGDLYDGRAADNWALGIILFECLTNRHLYGPLDVANMSNGYLALHQGTLLQYLDRHNLSRYFTANSFSLLVQLLSINGKNRLHHMHLLQHQWFAIYYNMYEHQLAKKFRFRAGLE